MATRVEGIHVEQFHAQVDLFGFLVDPPYGTCAHLGADVLRRRERRSNRRQNGWRSLGDS